MNNQKFLNKTCPSAALFFLSVILGVTCFAQTTTTGGRGKSNAPPSSTAPSGANKRKATIPLPPPLPPRLSGNAKSDGKQQTSVDRQTAEQDAAAKIVELKAEPDTPNVSGRDQALYDAVKRADAAAVKSLVEAKANVNVRKNGWTPLLLAAAMDREKAGTRAIEILKSLLEGGADVKAQNNWGETALHLASKQAQVEMVRLLLIHHAEPNVAATFGASKGQTPLGLVKANLRDHPKDEKYAEIKSLLEEGGAK